MKLYVGNFSFDMTERTLRELFEPFGIVSEVKLITDRETGQSRGFGFVTMGNVSEGNAAIQGLDGKDTWTNRARDYARALSVRFRLPPLTVRAYRHVIPNGTYHFPRAIEGGNLLEYTTVCFRNDEDFGPSAQPLMQPIGRSCATFREMPARAQASTTFDTSL